MLTLKNVKKYYNHKLIIDIELLKFPDTGLFFICGDSGCGKTTLLNIIAGFDQKYIGNIFPSQRIINYANQKNICFQSETALNNLLLCGTYDSKYLINYAKKFNLSRQTLDTLMMNLSGGEQARVCLAMNLLSNSNILLCDEITAGLDKENGEEVMKILKEEANKRLIICVSHNLEYAKKFGNDVLYFEQGNKVHKVFKNRKKSVNVKLKYNHFTMKSIIKLVSNKLNYKKVRTAICNSVLTIGLVSFCLSIIISNSIKSNFDEMFSHFWNKDQIIMKRKQVGEQQLVNTQIFEYEDILKNNPKYFKSISTYYFNNFESLFDVNEVHLRTNKKMLLNDLSLFSINNYQLCDNGIENDQIILGVNINVIRNICQFLNLYTYDINSLNDYLTFNNLLIEFHVKKQLWNYEDNVVFSIKKFVFNDVTTIFHSNPLFNEYIFEDLMRFKNHENETSNVPWILDKQYYLNCYDGVAFMRDSLYMDNFKKIIPDYFQNDHHKIIFKSCKIPNINQNDIAKIYEKVDVQDIQLGFNANYQIIESAMISGFTNDFILAKDEQILDEIISLNSVHSIDDKNKYPSFIGCAKITNFENNSFSVSTNFINYSGNMPQNDDEIVISSTLKELLNIEKLNSQLYVGYLFSSTIRDGRVFNNYKKSKLKIVGIKNCDEKAIFQDLFWLKRFLSNYLEVSNYELLIENAQIKLDEKTTCEMALEKLKAINDFDFENVTGDLTKTIDDVFCIVKDVLLGFSFLVIIMSIIMLILIVYLFLKENVNDFVAIYALGGKIRDVFIYKEMYVLMLIGRSMLMTMVILILIFGIFNMQSNQLIHIRLVDLIKSFIILLIFIITICLFLILFLQKYNKNEQNVADFLKFYK